VRAETATEAPAGRNCTELRHQSHGSVYGVLYMRRLTGFFNMNCISIVDTFCTYFSGVMVVLPLGGILTSCFDHSGGFQF
jgi:hypothetical protein